MSSFDSMIRTSFSLRCFSIQSASTSASGCAYCAEEVVIILKLHRQPGTRNRFEGRPCRRTSGPRRSLANSLKSPELPEPAQREPHLGSLQLVPAHEPFEAHSFESGAMERH